MASLPVTIRGQPIAVNTNPSVYNVVDRVERMPGTPGLSAAGTTTLNFQVPTSTAIFIHDIFVVLVTSAVAGNRDVYVSMYNEQLNERTPVYLLGPCPPSFTMRSNFAPNGSNSVLTTGAADIDASMSIYEGPYYDFYRVEVNVLNPQAGDVFRAFMHYSQVPTVNGRIR